jgi:hypothetical protein
LRPTIGIPDYAILRASTRTALRRAIRGPGPAGRAKPAALRLIALLASALSRDLLILVLLLRRLVAKLPSTRIRVLPALAPLSLPRLGLWLHSRRGRGLGRLALLLRPVAKLSSTRIRVLPALAPLSLPRLGLWLRSRRGRGLGRLALLLRPVAKLPSTRIRVLPALAPLSLPRLGLWLRSRRRRGLGGPGLLLPLLLGRPLRRGLLRRLVAFLPRLVLVLLGVRDREAGKQQCQNCRPYPQPVGVPAT